MTAENVFPDSPGSAVTTATTVTRFRSVATGPRRFLSRLRSRSIPFNRLLDSTHPIRALGKKIPAQILDGRMSHLMSSRLQKLLDNPAQPAVPQTHDASSPHVFSSPHTPSPPNSNPNSNHSHTAPGESFSNQSPFDHSLQPQDPHQQPGQFPGSSQTPAQPPGHSFPSLPGRTPDSPPTVTSPPPGAPGVSPTASPLQPGEPVTGLENSPNSLLSQFQRAMNKLWETSPAPLDHQTPSLSPHENSPGEAPPASHAPGSLLVEKLDQYMRLQSPQHPSPPDPGNKKNAPATPAGNLNNENNTPSLQPPAAPPNPLSSFPGFPSMPDDRLARQMNNFVSGVKEPAPNVQDRPAQAEPGLQDSIPPVMFQPNRGQDRQNSPAYPGDLAGQIAGILGEQAVRHGIDIS